MTKALYTAEAHVTGGRADGHGRSSDGVAARSTCACPRRWAARATARTPEELFAVGYAACFEGALGTVARRAKEDTGDVAIDSKVMLVTTEERGFTVAVELAVSLPAISDPAKAVELVRAAHRGLPRTRTRRAATSTCAQRERPGRRLIAAPGAGASGSSRSDQAAG